MPDQARIDKAKSALTRIATFDPQTLKKPGDYDFGDSIPDAENVKLLFKPLRADVFARLSNAILARLGDQLEEGAELLRRGQAFQPAASQNPNEERKTIQASLRSFCERVLDSPGELTAAIVQSLDVRSLAAEVDRKAVELQALVDKAGHTIQDVMVALTQARELLGKVTVSNEAERFALEANKHRNASHLWLVGSAGFALITGVFAVFAHVLFAHVGLTPAAVGDVQYLSSKAIVIVALLYLLHFCGRSYVAARHNETVNRHRSNALGTYRLLVDSVSEERNRDLVLAAAAGAIFAPQDTGFLKQSVEGDLTKVLLDRMGKSST